MRPKQYGTEILDRKEIKDLQYREMLDLIRPTKDQLEELAPKPTESSEVYFTRFWWFFARELLFLFLSTTNEAVKAKLGMGLLGFGVTPKSAIDISVRKSPIDSIDEEELIEKMVDRLLQHPHGRKLLEDKLGTQK